MNSGAPLVAAKRLLSNGNQMLSQLNMLGDNVDFAESGDAHDAFDFRLHPTDFLFRLLSLGLIPLVKMGINVGVGKLIAASIFEVAFDALDELAGEINACAITDERGSFDGFAPSLFAP